MTTLTVLAACIVGFVPQGSASTSTLKWPLVPDPLFALNGTASETPLQHVQISIKTDGIKEDPKSSDKDAASLILPLGSPAFKSLQLLFMSTADGTLAKFGGISLVVKTGHIWFAKDGNQVDIAPLKADGLNDVQVVKHVDSLIAYINGEHSVQTMMPTAPLLPLQVGLDTWKGTILGGQGIAKSLTADTKTVTVNAELGAFTPVPELERIAPYRSALVAEEYTITSITSGRMSAIKPGLKIRVFRWGLLAGKKTDVASIKTGDKAQLVIQPLSADPKYEKEFQVDTLDGDISAVYFVDVTPAK